MDGDTIMNDSEARGLVLKRLYEIRHQVRHANQNELRDLNIDPSVLGNILEQLAEQNLIDWKPARGGYGTYLALMARINSFGVNVIEGNVQSPIAITVDNSVNVQGSQNIQIGGQGNVQTVTMDIGKMITAVDSSGASFTEREEAKSLLKKIADNKLVQSVLGDWIKKYAGGS